ncbi:MAG TPA: proline dehydrogenase family protein [Actinomycetota bacterium]|jgi:RHH-type proline utilization regulon transcriptional repressor/proline dehydrogenase/delta 1-pyrroline-5-carboxylate dehydrogenase|nr:proline dehydrogenase family protein [Actinomycetota bacterium]
MEAAFERDVQELARRIAEAGASERTRVYHMTWWTDRLLDWAMDHPDFKTQLFRFVDVFPACRDNADVARHLEEYFADVEVPTALELGMEAAEHVPFGAKIEAAVTRRNVLRMARQFIAGATPSDALPQLRKLWRDGEASTVDLLGEKTITETEAEAYADRVHELLAELARDAEQWPDDAHLERDAFGSIARVSVSIKPTALAPLYAPLTRDAGLEQAYGRLRDICEHARELGAAVYLDMEHYDVKDLTLELVRRVGDAFDSLELGAVVQAYLTDSYDDLTALVSWARGRATPVSVRLVKGAYWDYETAVAASHGWPPPVYESKAQTDANYERCVRYLVENAGVIRPAFATHNIRTLAYAITSARLRGLHETSVELQLLYGMAEPVHTALRRLGFRVRAYAPVGDLVPGMAYLVRRLLENTANESFLRNRFVEGRDLDQLIRPPDVAEGELAWRPEAPAITRDDPFRNEPPAEFRRAFARDSMRAAVETAARMPSFDAPAIIAGGRIPTKDAVVSADPAGPAHEVCRSARCGASEVDRAVEAALKDQPAWGRADVSHRADVLFRAAAIMRSRRAELAALEVLEAGKPWAQADADVCEAVDFCEFYGREALRLARVAAVTQVAGERNAYVYQPRGLVAVISPWNFPLAIPCGMVAAALVCGNAVLFKPAEQTPGIALRLVEILLEAGVPDGILAFLPGLGEEVGAALVDRPETSVIAFTGSKDVGLSIVERASATRPGQRHVKRVIAEMGGKNAVVVDSDADLDVAVPAIIESAFGYSGQKCSAASRVIGVGPIFQDLVDRLVGAARLLPVGLPYEMSTVVGPLIDEDAWKKVRGYQEIAHEEGDVVLQRDDVPERGWFVGPTIVVTRAQGSRIATEEIFGPVLVCIPADDFDHALTIADATPYALTAGVFSRSPSRIARAATELRAGNVYINRSITGAAPGRQPFGGYGLSGVGSKAGGPDYLLQFTDPRVVSENTIRQGFAPLEDD